MTKKLKAFCLGMAFSLSTFVWAAPANVEDVINSKYLKEFSIWSSALAYIYLKGA